MKKKDFSWSRHPFQPAVGYTRVRQRTIPRENAPSQHSVHPFPSALRGNGRFLPFAAVLLSMAVAWPRAARCANRPKVAPVKIAAGARGGLRAAPALRALSFERNEGQTDGRVKYLAHGQGYSLFLTQNEAVLALRRASGKKAGKGLARVEQSVVRLRLVGANLRAPVTGEEELPGKSNYFIGRDPAGWRTDVPTYARVRYAGTYPGVDVVYYGRQGQLEYDFNIAPGADPRQVSIGIAGASARLNAAGALVLQTKTGNVELHRPVAYQLVGAKKRFVEVRYVWRARDEVGLEVAAYRRSQELIIDPALTYSTYLGGSGGDIAYGIAVDSSGDAYVTGATGSINFPVASAYQSTYGGNTDAFISKINPTGTGLIYSTYVGSGGVNYGNGIAVDSSGDAYITGSTTSTGFPVTKGAYQITLGGGTTPNATSNAFILKLSSAGSALDYSTYLGGTAADSGQAIAIDSSGNAYVTGSTTSPNFPVMPVASPFQVGNAACTVVNDVTSCFTNAFVSKLNSTGTALIYSTYLGGSEADSGEAIAVDANGDCYVGGYANSSNFPLQNPLQSSSGGGTDGFVAEFNPAGTALVFSTYLGGSGNDQVYGLTLDSADSIYVTGQTQSSNFPTSTGTYQNTYQGDGDAFVTKLSPQGALIVYSTFLGGTEEDQGNGIAVDSSGDAFVVGYTQSSDFPSLDPLQTLPGITGAGTCNNTICPSAFITELNPSGIPDYSTYLGGSGSNVAQAVALNSSGVPYVAGSTSSTNFPVIEGALEAVYAGSGTSGNAFIAEVSPGNSPAVALTPQAINFGNETLNQASNTESVTLTNEGSAPLEITSITPSGPFTETNNCGTTVTQGGGTCTINVVFTPTVAQSYSDEVTITDNAAGSPHYITLTGSGGTASAGLTMIPSSLTFPTLAVGQTSSFQTVEIVNTSKASVSITEFSISSQFTEVNNCGVANSNVTLSVPVVLNAGASCQASIFFAPTSGGAQTGTFSLISNASGSASVSLTGNGGSEFTLSSTASSSTILVGKTKTSFTVAATALVSSFTSSISLACSSGVTCSFNPTSITPGETSTVTVTGLSASSSNPTSFSVTGTASSQTVSLPLSIFLEDFSLSATPAVGSVAAGSTTGYTVTVTPLNGFNEVVLLSCSGLPANSSCTFTPPDVVINPSVPVNARMSICTTSELVTGDSCTTSLLVHFPHAPRVAPGGKRWLIPAAALLLLLALLAGYKRFPGRLKRRYWVVTALALILLSLSLTSCNDLYYEDNIAPAPQGTPAGTVTLTLTGALGSETSVTRTTTVNLSVGPTTN